MKRIFTIAVLLYSKIQSWHHLKRLLSTSLEGKLKIMPVLRWSIFTSFAVLATASTEADVTGHFSRANCINNESITFLPLAPLSMAVISWHKKPAPQYYEGHYAGDEDPVACSIPTCPTSPGWDEDARCEESDNCLWTFSFHTLSGRWAAIHRVSGLDSDASSWTSEGRHVIWLGEVFGIPLYQVIDSGPETDCNL